MSKNILTDAEKEELWKLAEAKCPCDGSHCFRYDGDVNHSGSCQANDRGRLYTMFVGVAERFKKV